MLSILGDSVRLYDGITRREALRVGGLGFTGLAWSDLFRVRAQAAPTPTRTGSFGKAKACNRRVQLRWAVAPRHIRPQTRRTTRDSRRVQANRDPRSRHTHHRTSAEARDARRPIHPRSLGHAQRQRSRHRCVSRTHRLLAPQAHHPRHRAGRDPARYAVDGGRLSRNCGPPRSRYFHT